MRARGPSRLAVKLNVWLLTTLLGLSYKLCSSCAPSIGLKSSPPSHTHRDMHGANLNRKTAAARHVGLARAQRSKPTRNERYEPRRFAVLR